MKSILILSPSLPLPPTDGGKIRVLNLARQATEKFDVTLLALEADGTDQHYVRELREEGINAILVNQAIARAPQLTGRATLRALMNDLPMTVSKYYLKDYSEAIRSTIAARDFDLIHFEMIHFAQYLPEVRELTQVPAVLSTQNIDSDVWRRSAEHQPTALKRRIFEWQVEVLERAERTWGAQFDGITAASEQDAAYYRELFPDKPVEAIDNGVDLEHYQPKPEEEEPATLVYTGSYDWLPNSDAVVYFCSDIWPALREQLPNVRFFAVGKSPTSAMRAFDGRDGITVSGRVEDVLPYIARASVYVVPLRIGGGTRLKILEAMAMAKPVVSTSVGCEGLDVQPSRDLLTADDPDAFVEAITSLEDDAARRRELGATARKRVEERYGWDNIGTRMNEFYERLIGEARPVVGS